MSDLDEQLYDEESQRQAEIELEAERRQEMQEQQAQEQQAQANQSGVAGLIGRAATQGKEMVKQEVKRRIKRQILLWILSLLSNPYTWLAIGLIFVAFLLEWCKDNKLECLNLLGSAFWDIVKFIFGLD